MYVGDKTLFDSTTDTIQINAICIDGGTQPRDKIDEATVTEYTQALEHGSEFPPVVVFFDDVTYWLADGFHRVAAHRRAGRTDIRASVRQGQQRDALLYSVGANNEHGLRRSPEDKRRAVLTLLKDMEWGAWSSNKIADICHVSHTFDDNLRATVTCNVASENAPSRSREGKRCAPASQSTAVSRI